MQGMSIFQITNFFLTVNPPLYGTLPHRHFSLASNLSQEPFPDAAAAASFRPSKGGGTARWEEALGCPMSSPNETPPKQCVSCNPTLAVSSVSAPQPWSSVPSSFFWHPLLQAAHQPPFEIFFGRLPWLCLVEKFTRNNLDASMWIFHWLAIMKVFSASHLEHPQTQILNLKYAPRLIIPAVALLGLSGMQVRSKPSAFFACPHPRFLQLSPLPEHPKHPVGPGCRY